jgi:prophage maintenance system killer protein
MVLELVLRLNGYHLAADNAACVRHIPAFAAGDESDEQFIAWVRARATR